MTTTLAPSPRHRDRAPNRRRRPAIAAGLALVVLGCAGLAVALASDDETGNPLVRTGIVKHQVTYEVPGTGRVPVITYVVGPGNRSRTITDVKLPWSRSVSLPVGPGGGFAQLEVKSPATGLSAVQCRVLVDGELKRETVNDDGFTGASCTTPITANYVS